MTGTGNRLSTDGTWNFTYDDEGNTKQKVHATSTETSLALTLAIDLVPGKIASLAARAIGAGYRFVRQGGQWVVMRLRNGRLLPLTQHEATEFVQRFVPWATGTRLGTTIKNTLRRDARKIWAAVAGPIPNGVQVHHRVPLQWAHIFPDANPNKLRNLYAITAQHHTGVTNAWNAWERTLAGRVPTQAEVLQQANVIEAQFGHLMTTFPFP